MAREATGRKAKKKRSRIEDGDRKVDGDPLSEEDGGITATTLPNDQSVGVATMDLDIDSDDEGPEDVLLVSGRDKALEQKRLEAAAVKRVKLSVKEKRRLKAEMFKKQKDAKHLRKLAKFPEGALDKALSIMTQEKVTGEEKRTKSEARRKKKSSRAAAKKAMPSVAQLGSVKVVACDGAAQQRTCAVGYERAREFLQEHFYGGRLKRVPALSQHSRKTLLKPAANFISSQ